MPPGNMPVTEIPEWNGAGATGAEMGSKATHPREGAAGRASTAQNDRCARIQVDAGSHDCGRPTAYRNQSDDRLARRNAAIGQSRSIDLGDVAASGLPTGNDRCLLTHDLIMQATTVIGEARNTACAGDRRVVIVLALAGAIAAGRRLRIPLLRAAATVAALVPQIDADRPVFADAEEQGLRTPRGSLRHGGNDGNKLLQGQRGTEHGLHRPICICDALMGQ